jgi:hypothetical protein
MCLKTVYSENRIHRNETRLCRAPCGEGWRRNVIPSKKEVIKEEEY